MHTPSQLSKQHKRSIVFWIFLIVSIPLGIFIISYAAGYRFDSRTNSVVEQSAVAIEALPKNVDIYINTELVDTKTPYIKTVLPGIYTVRLQKEGYVTWEKKLNLNQGRSKIFPSVLLFKSNEALTSKEPPIAASTRFETLPTSAYEQYTAAGFQNPAIVQYLDGSKTLVVDKQQGVSYIVDSIEEFSVDHRLNAAVSFAQWSQQDMLLYVIHGELWVYNPTSSEQTLLTRRSKKILSALWHPDGGYIFFTDEDGLYAIELDPRDSRQIWQLSELENGTDLRLSTNEKSLYLYADNETTGKQEWYEKQLHD